ncbi:armadillo-type protein [Mycena latifolia]|nr:armadillo-type protein [Mycena latifolia]
MGRHERPMERLRSDKEQRLTGITDVHTSQPLSHDLRRNAASNALGPDAGLVEEVVQRRTVNSVEASSGRSREAMSNTGLDVRNAKKARRPAVNDEACPGVADIPPAVSPYAFLSGTGPDFWHQSQNRDVMFGAAEVLIRIAKSAEGAHAALDAKVLDVHALFEFSSESRELIEIAVQTLSQTVKMSASALIALGANLLENVAERFDPADAIVRERAWDTVKMKLRHELTAEPIAQLIVSLFQYGGLRSCTTSITQHRESDTGLDVDKIAEDRVRTVYYEGDDIDVEPSHDNFDVVEDVAKLLNSIATSAEGAQAVVDAHALDCVVELLDSRNTGVKVWTCELLAKAACHQSTRVGVLRLNPCFQLVSLLRDQDPVVIERSARTLCRIARVEEGALSAVDAKVLDYAQELLGSPNTMVCLWTSLPTIGVPHAVHTTAISTLARISESPDGAAAVAAAQFMVYASDLTDHEVQRIAKNLSGRCQSGFRYTEEYDIEEITLRANEYGVEVGAGREGGQGDARAGGGRVKGAGRGGLLCVDGRAARGGVIIRARRDGRARYSAAFSWTVGEEDDMPVEAHGTNPERELLTVTVSPPSARSSDLNSYQAPLTLRNGRTMELVVSSNDEDKGTQETRVGEKIAQIFVASHGNRKVLAGIETHASNFSHT